MTLCDFCDEKRHGGICDPIMIRKRTRRLNREAHASRDAELASLRDRLRLAIDCGDGNVCGTVGSQCQKCLRVMFHRVAERESAACRALGTCDADEIPSLIAALKARPVGVPDAIRRQIESGLRELQSGGEDVDEAISWLAMLPKPCAHCCGHRVAPDGMSTALVPCPRCASQPAEVATMPCGYCGDERGDCLPPGCDVDPECGHQRRVASRSLRIVGETCPVDDPAEVATGERDASGFRVCSFCGCKTNAYLRACCDMGRNEDLAKSRGGE